MGARDISEGQEFLFLFSLCLMCTHIQGVRNGSSHHGFMPTQVYGFVQYMYVS